MGTKPPEDLPQVGRIAYYDDVPVAIGFLRMAEGNLGIFDSLITNPASPSDWRHVALDALGQEIISLARDKGCKRLLGFSINSDTLLRSEKHGFLKQPHTVLSLNL